MKDAKEEQRDEWKDSSHGRHNSGEERDRATRKCEEVPSPFRAGGGISVFVDLCWLGAAIGVMQMSRSFLCIL